MAVEPARQRRAAARSRRRRDRRASSSPSSVATPTTCGDPGERLGAGDQPGDRDTAPDVEPRCGRRRRRPIAASITGRRPVMASNRSSPSRRPPVISLGRAGDGVEAQRARGVEGRRSPRAARRLMSSRKRGWKKWSMRNWLTPRRSQSSHAASASAGAGAASRSRTVTSWPSPRQQHRGGEPGDTPSDHQHLHQIPPCSIWPNALGV